VAGAGAVSERQPSCQQSVKSHTHFTRGTILVSLCVCIAN